MQALTKYRKMIVLLPTVALALGLVAACGGDDDDPTPTAMPQPTATAPAASRPVVTLEGHDFSFAGPDTYEAGWIDLTFENVGQEPHHAQFAKLNDGVTMEQLSEALQQPDPAAAFALVSFAGGAGMIGPGQTTNVSMKLDEGNYAIMCFIGGPDGVPHLAKGMLMPITVTAATADAPAPEADIVVSMADFSFDIPETLEAGEITIMAENHGEQPHEMMIVKLNDGATVDEVLAFMETPPGSGGEQPFTEVGGVQAMGAHGAGVMTVTMDAGDYVAICFIPDPESSAPHFALGMIDEFTVQ